jgi:hypothetical protein
MLHEFLTSNREEIIRRCKGKVGLRSSPAPTAVELEHGVPLFLGQLVEALLSEQVQPPKPCSAARAAAESSRTAALHGKELLERGYTVEQVVHGYGDICQAITELAKETHAPVTVDEFHTFNRMLDNAIADAVSSYGSHRDDSISAQGDQDLHVRMGALAAEQRRLLDTALKALDALKVGNIGVMGATGALLEDSLVQLRDVIDRSLPEIRLASRMTTPPDG